MSTRPLPEFTPVDRWEQLPEGIHHRDVCGMDRDSQDRLYVLTRGDAHILVFERDGAFVRSMGEGVLTNGAHGIRLGEDGAIFCVSSGEHIVRRFDAEGHVDLVMGTDGVASETGGPFNMPTGLAVAPNGDLYVSDGYGNARVHHFSNDGTRIATIGGPDGTKPESFWAPHGICVDSAGDMYVGEVSYSFGGYGERGDLPRGVKTLQKLARGR